jgi:hypothetical protein
LLYLPQRNGAAGWSTRSSGQQASGCITDIWRLTTTAILATQTEVSSG